MLSKLLELLETHPVALTQEQICKKLSVSPGSLQLLLDILVRKGRLIADPLRGDGACPADCAGCPISQECSLDTPVVETIYRVAIKT